MKRFTSTSTIMVFGVALLAAAAPPPEHAGQMTAEEIRQVFQTEPGEEPEYEVVPITWPNVQTRDAETRTYLRLKAFGSDIGLWLKPIDGILAGYDTPVYYAKYDKTANHGINFHKINQPLTVPGQMLEDKERKATLVVKQAANGKKIVSGTIESSNLAIRPLPHRFAHSNFNGRRRSADDDNVDDATIEEHDGSYHHVIYKIPPASEGIQYVIQPINTDLLDRESSKSKRSTNIPSILYPEILVVVDDASYERHNKNLDALLEYLLPFWNAVDLKYRSLEYPKIRLNIAGIIIGADPNILPYIKRNKVTANKIDIHTALHESGIFKEKIKSAFPLMSYDIMVTMSPYDMCSPQKKDCPSGVLGLAYIEGACQNNFEHGVSQSVSVAIIQDKGAFDGVHTAAHELGHLFGARHDNDPESACTTNGNFIMAPTTVLSENSLVWSPCSVRQFDTFFRRKNVMCLFNEPQLKSPIVRVLPGRLQTMDDQCMKLTGQKSCSMRTDFLPHIVAKLAADICVSLVCGGHTCKFMNIAPADGAICGKGKICLQGKCIRESDITYRRSKQILEDGYLWFDTVDDYDSNFLEESLPQP